MPNLDRLGVAWLLLSCCVLTVVGAFDGIGSAPGRDLLQMGNQVVINELNAGRLADIVGDLENGTTVLFDVDSIELNDVVQVDASDVAITGRQGEKRTRIICNRRKSGIELRGTGTLLENLAVQGCKDTAVKVVNRGVEDRSLADFSAQVDVLPVSATVRNVVFTGSTDAVSGRDFGAVGGGGLGVHPGTAVLVDNCTFRDNGRYQGGAISVSGANLTVLDSVFSGNVAKVSGGAIKVVFEQSALSGVRVDGSEIQSVVNITGCVFSGNTDTESGGSVVSGITTVSGAPLESSQFIEFPYPPPSGGAVFAKKLSQLFIKDTVFDSNMAVAGGAVNLFDCGEVQLSNNTFVNNEARGMEDELSLAQGGALYIVSVTDQTTGTLASHVLTMNKFENNTASYGGALHLITAVESKVQIDENEFKGNTAWLGGGAAVFRNTGNILVNSLKFVGNKAQVGGGIMMANAAGMFGSGAATFETNTMFEANEALDGGAMFFLGAGQVNTQFFQFLKNRARRNGGAVAAMDSLASGSISLQDSAFISNFAQRGGAIFVDSISSFRLQVSAGQTMVFEDNAALAGGAIYARLQNQVQNGLTISGALFKGNRAANATGDVGYHLVEVPQNEMSHIPNDTVTNSAKGAILDPTSDEPCSPGGGGAICLALTRAPERGTMNIVIMDTAFTANSASTGGAMLVATDKNSVWLPPSNCTVRKTGANALAPVPCRGLGMTNVHFEDNSAVYAGGAVFASDPENVWVNEDDREEFMQLSTVDVNNMSLNTKGVEGFGPNVASTARELKFSSNLTENGFLVEGHLGGKPLPPITVDVQDAFDQRISAGVTDAHIKVTASGDCAGGMDCISGQRTADAMNGVVVFDSIRVNAPPGNYSLVLIASDLERVTMPFSIRDCVPGEFNVSSQNICDPCSTDEYSFLPTVPCRDCDSNALCAGGASLVPQDGYWHSSPFSIQFHQCLVEEACRLGPDFSAVGKRNQSLTTRTDILADFYIDLTLEEVELALQTGRVYSNEEYRQCEKGYMGILCGSCEPEYGHLPGGECVPCNFSKMKTGLFILLVALWTLLLLGFAIRSALSSIRDFQEMTVLGQVSCKRLQVNGQHAAQDAGTTSQKGKQAVPLRQSESLPGRRQVSVDHIIAAEKVSETLKIATNFLQVTGFAVSINVKWTSAVKKLLGLWDALVGFSNGSSLVALDCILDDEGHLPKSFRALLSRIAFPVGLFFVVIIIFALYYIYLRHKNPHEPISYLKSRCMISLLAVVFFAYQNITEELMRTVNCVQLDEFESDVKEYNGFAIARGDYWGVDTSKKCYEGGHAQLAFFVGIPGLLLFSGGIPVFLLVLLLWSKHHDKLQDRDFLNTYGFVYQNYTSSHVYWEVVILVRKALIGAVIVFAYEAGPNLQGVMALGILIVALVFHLHAIPYKYKTLNILEAISLIVSILTFYAGVVFNDDNTSPGAEVLLTVLLFVVNTGLALYMLFKIAHYVDAYVTARLRAYGTKDDQVPSSFPGRCYLLCVTALAEKVATLPSLAKFTEGIAVFGREQRAPTEQLPWRDEETKVGEP